MADTADVVAEALQACDLEPLERVTLRSTEWTAVERVKIASGSIVAKAFTAERASLGPHALARKSQLVASELAPAIDVRVPAVIAVHDTASASVVVTEDVPSVGWSVEHAVEAARSLRRLHDVAVGALSNELTHLMRATERNRKRVQIGVQMMVAAQQQARREVPGWVIEVSIEEEPDTDRPVPIHGDYFAANLLPLPSGDVVVVDWDLLGFGDAMWDLSFLLDASAPAGGAAEALAAYGPVSRAEAARLSFHRRVWRAFRTLQVPPLSTTPNDE